MRYHKENRKEHSLGDNNKNKNTTIKRQTKLRFQKCDIYSEGQDFQTPSTSDYH